MIRQGFVQGLLDGLLARRIWDPSVARAQKTVGYVCGTLWAVATQPLALYCAVMDISQGLVEPI